MLAFVEAPTLYVLVGAPDPVEARGPTMEVRPALQASFNVDSATASPV